MLIALDIENIAVIERASLELTKGLNVITGETGAGKSLLINSLNMLLGARTSREIIREGTDFAKVSGVFFEPELDSILDENGISPDDGNIIISRKLFSDGRNICHINGCAVNVAVLKSIGEKLVVIHGQHDSSELINMSSHIRFLDDFSKNSDLLFQYREAFHEYKEAERMLAELNEDTTARQNEIDYLTFQTEEIKNASLSVQEEEELTVRRNILENAEAISRYTETAYGAIASDGGAKELIHKAKRALESLGDIDEGALPFSEKLTELYYELEEVGRDISSYASGIDFSPYELSEINDKLALINSLKRKYNLDVEGILEYYDSACKKLEFLHAFEDNKTELIVKRDGLFAKANSLADSLSATRKKYAPLLSDRLSEELNSLDMPKCRIEFAFSECELSENGKERVELLISTNPAESPKSLVKIASGGEISRVMLAIKTVFSDFDNIPTLLFDEIDTGVSGRAAEKIANKMRQLSNSYQLITVTHLPVIAAAANHHLLLEKQTDSDCFKTVVRPLSEDDRIREIARIISGDNVNEISLENARQMLRRD